MVSERLSTQDFSSLSLMVNTFINTFSLTKDYRNRPKYPELLESAFIKMYESANVDVAAWFASVMHTNNQQSNNTELRR